MSSCPRPWTPSLERRARTLREAGANWTEISHALGITAQRLQYRLEPENRERRLAAARARYELMVSALGPKVREPVRHQALTLRLRGQHLERLEQVAAWRGLGLHATARRVLIEALERDDLAEFT